MNGGKSLSPSIGMAGDSFCPFKQKKIEMRKKGKVVSKFRIWPQFTRTQTALPSPPLPPAPPSPP